MRIMTSILCLVDVVEKESNGFDIILQSEALRALSLMPRQVVATGGGAVIRPINWYSVLTDV